MKAFEYAAPRSEREVLELLAAERGKTEVLAGGTDLVGLMKKMIVTPDRVVSLSRVDSLRSIEADSTSVRIGAMVTLEDLLDNPVSEFYPAIRQAIGQRDNAGAGGPGAQRMVRNLAGSLFAGGVGVGPDDNVAPLEASPIRLAHRAATAGPGHRNTIIE